MSGSFPIFDRVAEQFIGLAAPAGALDLGAGAGKYGRALRRLVPACESLAVEIDTRHVDAFALRDIYARVEIADAGRWWRDNPDEIFDLVIAGDCLQHLPKSEGLDLLNAMVYRCAWLLVLVPEFVVQGTVGGAGSAVHRSVWSERDMHWHDLWAWDNARAMSIFLLRGYQPSNLSIDSLVNIVNEGVVPVLDFDGQTVVRPCRLRMVDQSRELAYRPR
ncbi:MAG: class I SAM-dependent methyltransferase [Rubrivivax sp.]|nr:class I SAM-dependent methyltransferase [Rubrivivax sp.]